jgi:hypothetical protein
VIIGQKKLHKERLINFYSSPNIIQIKEHEIGGTYTHEEGEKLTIF